MRRARALWATVLGGALLMLSGCSSAALPAGVRAEASHGVTPAFEQMRRALMDAQRLQQAGDGARLRAVADGLSREGLALLAAGLPHDVRRADIPRFNEGRQAFGEALKRWARSAGAPGDDANLFESLTNLVNAYWGWVDAYRGLPAETSV